MSLPDEENWYWHECARCEAIVAGLIRRKTPPGSDAERPVIIIFQKRPKLFDPVIADLNHLPFEADDGASECGGRLPVPWAWEDLNPALLARLRSKNQKLFGG